MSAKPTVPLRRSARIAAQRRPSQPAGIPKQRSPKTHPKLLGPLDVTTWQATTKSRLLSLPPELRNMIWEFALTSPTGTLEYSPKSHRFEVSPLGVSLLTTCHLTALETQYLPLKLNKLVFPCPGTFLRFMNKRARIEAKLGRVLEMKGVQIERVILKMECVHSSEAV